MILNKTVFIKSLFFFVQNDKLNFEHNSINYVVTKTILNKTSSFCITVYIFKHTCMAVNQYLR